MRFKRPTSGLAAAALAAAALVSLAGCGLLPGELQEADEVVIPPAEAGPSSAPGLGPTVDTLSFSPGDKGSPRVSPSGERVAFILGGRVTEKPLYAQEEPQGENSGAEGGLRAEHAEWLPDGTLATLDTEVEEEDAGRPTPGSLSVAREEDDPPNGQRREVVGEVLAVGALPGGEAVVAAVESPVKGSTGGETTSMLVSLKGAGEPVEYHMERIEGHVTGLSVSPDGERAVLAVLRDGEGGGGRCEIQVYHFSEGRTSLAARLPAGVDILGAPQWTEQGVHFVADEAGAKAGETGGADPSPPALYRTVPDFGEPEPVSGVGEDFVAASASVSPDGDRLAVVGRRNPGAPTELYLLNLGSEALTAATTNKDMEIKTNPRDLAWSPDGRSVVLVARETDAAASEPSPTFYNLYQIPVGDPENTE